MTVDSRKSKVAVRLTAFAKATAVKKPGTTYVGAIAALR
jgi:hypothetical protein